MLDRPTGQALALWLAAFTAVAGWPTMATAGTVQKCIGGDGHVTFTSRSCPQGQRLAGTYDAVPEAVPPASAAEPAPRERKAGGASPRPGGASRGTARGGGAKAKGRSRETRCQAARDRREATLRRVGLKRTFDLLRKLDDAVNEACRP